MVTYLRALREKLRVTVRDLVSAVTSSVTRSRTVTRPKVAVPAGQETAIAPDPIRRAQPGPRRPGLPALNRPGSRPDSRAAVRPRPQFRHHPRRQRMRGGRFAPGAACSKVVSGPPLRCENRVTLRAVEALAIQRHHQACGRTCAHLRQRLEGYGAAIYVNIQNRISGRGWFWYKRVCTLALSNYDS